MNNSIYLYNEYTNIPDEQVISKIQSGDKQALDYIMDKYTDLVKLKASRFFIQGAEKDDIIQEGLIGLYKATKSFIADRDSSFRSFANMCIERQLITAVKTSNRQKNSLLNGAFSLNSTIDDADGDDSREIMDVIDANTQGEDPLEIITKQEYYKLIGTQIDNSLSEFEGKVLSHYNRGESYANIAKELNCNVKSVDTAIQRIRKKANKIKTNMDLN